MMMAGAIIVASVALVGQAGGGERGTGGQGPRIQVLARKSIDWLTEQAEWERSGGREGSVAVEPAEARVGERAIHFRVRVDWYNEGRYPQGWPSFQYRPDKPLDFSGWDMIRFWVKAETSRPEGRPVFRFILHTGGKGRINKPIAGLRWGQWRQVYFDLGGVPELDKVTLIHFFICESDFRHDDRLQFVVDGFELLRTRRGLEANPPDKCGVELFVGPGERVVIVDEGTQELGGKVVVHTGAACRLTRQDRLVWRARELFSAAETTRAAPLGRDIPAGSVTTVEVSIPWASLAPGPGYYLVTCDVVRGGRSLSDGWVGMDDVYVRAKDEPMTYTVLSVRLGMAGFVRDLLYGGLMGRTHIALPHTLDPLEPRTYLDFVREFAHWTGKHSEGLEAGLAGLVFSGEALRRRGDKERAEFNDHLLRDSIEYMVSKMLLSDGSTLVHRNDLVDEYGELIGAKGGPTAWDYRDSNQMGEWLRPISRAIIYWQRLGMNAHYCQRLLRPCRRVANFLVRESVDPLGRWNSVMYHYRFRGFGADMSKQRYWQEGRQCDVYVGRALSGLAYYSYALLVTGHKVPQAYIECLRDTTEWAYEKMKPHGGWFDWQCKDEVEGGCHTYLGNMYIAEATFGWYLVAKRLGLKKDAALAAEATRMAYHYVTDRCYIRGRKFGIPLSFWVGPYLYWELTEYLGSIGPDETFARWMGEMHRKWAVEHKWEDFLAREPGHVGRTATNGALEVSILGYLGLRLMEEMGQAFRY